MNFEFLTEKYFFKKVLLFLSFTNITGIYLSLRVLELFKSFFRSKKNLFQQLFTILGQVFIKNGVERQRLYCNQLAFESVKSHLIIVKYAISEVIYPFP